VSAVINMDDPLAPPPRDTPPSPKDPADAPPAPAGSTAPRRGRKAGDAQLKLDLKEIEEKLGNLLELPGIPMAAAGDVWPAQHIERHAHPLAKAIANACKDNPQLRAKLLQLLRVSDNASLAVAVFSYLVPILLYYGLLPVPPIVRAQLQVPDRNEPGVRSPSIAEQLREQALRSQHGEQADPPPATNEPPPPGQPPPPRAASAI
jgi:hypothetical protein